MCVCVVLCRFLRRFTYGLKALKFVDTSKKHHQYRQEFNIVYFNVQFGVAGAGY